MLWIFLLSRTIAFLTSSTSGLTSMHSFLHHSHENTSTTVFISCMTCTNTTTATWLPSSLLSYTVTMATSETFPYDTLTALQLTRNLPILFAESSTRFLPRYTQSTRFFFLFRWMRTLVPSSQNCAMCRKEFKQPHAEAQAADTDFMMRIAAVRFRSYSIHIENRSLLLSLIVLSRTHLSAF